jgi:hypothetical protein
MIRNAKDFRHYLYLRVWFAQYWLIHNLGAWLLAKTGIKSIALSDSSIQSYRKRH